MDNIIGNTAGIVKTIMLTAKNSLLKAWENHDHTKDFSETIVDTFDKIPEPFSALRTHYLQSTCIKKNLSYVEIREVVLHKKISVKHWKKQNTSCRKG